MRERQRYALTFIGACVYVGKPSTHQTRQAKTVVTYIHLYSPQR